MDEHYGYLVTIKMLNIDKEVRERARQAAYVLHRYALVHGSIALVGHNYFNSMIGTELRAMGWSGSPILA